MTSIFYLSHDIFLAVGGITQDWRPKNNLLSFGNLLTNLKAMYFYTIIYLHSMCVPKIYAV